MYYDVIDGINDLWLKNPFGKCFVSRKSSKADIAANLKHYSKP